MNSVQAKSITVHHANWQDVMNTIVEPESIDLVICDRKNGLPTKNEDTQLSLQEMFKAIERVTKPHAAVILFADGMDAAELMTGPWRKWFRYALIWEKHTKQALMNCCGMPMPCHGDILVFYRQPPVYNPQMVEIGRPVHACTRKQSGSNYGRSEGGVNKRAGATTRHPGSVIQYLSNDNNEFQTNSTDKPVALCEFLIRSYSNPGATILDFSMGTGATGVAVERVGERMFIGIEQDYALYNVAAGRLGLSCSGCCFDLVPASTAAYING